MSHTHKRANKVQGFFCFFVIFLFLSYFYAFFLISVVSICSHDHYLGSESVSELSHKLGLRLFD